MIRPARPRRAEGAAALAPYFVAVANIEAPDGGEVRLAARHERAGTVPAGAEL